ncbi:MAG TPA: hypothetical protein VF576_00165 [Rubricoccaceae bacterium]
MTPPRPPSRPDDADIDWDVVPPRPTSAFDRLQTRTVQVARSAAPRLPQKGRTPLLVAGLVGLLAAGTVGAWWFRRVAPASDTDLLGRLSTTAAEFTPSYLTADDDQAEAYVADVFGWPIGLPELPGLNLVGVGEAALSPQLSVPAFRYEGDGGEATVVFAYDYVFLDQAEGTLDLPEATYAQLAEPEPVDTRRLGDAYLVSWRHRAVVYTAVTESEETFELIGRSVRGGGGPGRAPTEGPRETPSAEAPADAAPPAEAPPS